MTILHGPADADRFRQEVGRYNERWYVDPLPGCDIAPADEPDTARPSWSTVKGAAGKDWSFVANKRNAHADATELHRIADLDPTQRAKAFNAINSAGLDQAAGRGTIIHLWAEDLLFGREPREISDIDLMAMKLPKAALTEALLYRPALLDFFEAYQPEPAAAEYVAICRELNGIGYGCTPDALVRIQGEIAGIDWKSRTFDSKHGAYPEEGAQIAAGARADYMIVDDGNGGAKRQLLPAVAHGLVVSIKPEGARVYPIDLDGAWKHVEAMHAFWVARRDERSFIGRVWAPKVAAKGSTPPRDNVTASPEPLAASNRDRLRERIRSLMNDGHEELVRKAWPQGVPPLSKDGHTTEQLEAILAALRKVEADIGAQFHDDDMQSAKPEPRPKVETPAPAPAIDEGGNVSVGDVEKLQARLGALPANRRDVLKEIAAEAHAEGRSISISQRPTERRHAIVGALIDWAASSASYDDLWAGVALVASTTDDADERLGSIVSRLTIDEATRLADTFTARAAA